MFTSHQRLEPRKSRCTQPVKLPAQFSQLSQPQCYLLPLLALSHTLQGRLPRMHTLRPALHCAPRSLAFGGVVKYNALMLARTAARLPLVKVSTCSTRLQQQLRQASITQAWTHNVINCRVALRQQWPPSTHGGTGRIGIRVPAACSTCHTTG